MVIQPRNHISTHPNSPLMNTDQSSIWFIWWTLPVHKYRFLKMHAVTKPRVRVLFRNVFWKHSKNGTGLQSQLRGKHRLVADDTARFENSLHPNVSFWASLQVSFRMSLEITFARWLASSCKKGKSLNTDIKPKLPVYESPQVNFIRWTG